MSIPDHARANFQTLLRAAADGNLALLECADAETGAVRYVICAVGRDAGEFAGVGNVAGRAAVTQFAVAHAGQRQYRDAQRYALHQSVELRRHQCANALCIISVSEEL